MIPLMKVKNYSFKENRGLDDYALRIIRGNPDLRYLRDFVEAGARNITETTGQELTEDQKHALETRIYFAIDYLREQKKKIERQKTGKLLFNQDTAQTILEKAEGKKIAFDHSGFMGKERLVLKVKKIKGEYYLMKPRARRAYYYQSNFWGENCEII